MKQVTTVEFRKNIYKYLPDLPIAIVAKGKIVFFAVKEVSTNVKELSTNKVDSLDQKIQKTVETQSDTPTEIFNGKSSGESDETWGELIWDYCRATRTHPWNVGFKKCVYATATDGDGNMAQVLGRKWDKVPVCLPCLKNLEQMIPEFAYGVGFTAFHSEGKEDGES